MTRLDLDAIRARCDAATPGPWHVVTVTYPNGNSIVESIIGVGEPQIVDYGDGDSEWFTERVTIVKTDGGHYGPEKPDADFIAAARTDIPALLAYVEELTQERDEERMRTRCLEQMLAEAQTDLEDTRGALHAAQSKSDYWRNEFRNERLTFESCNRARQAAEDECAELRARIAELEARRWSP